MKKGRRYKIEKKSINFFLVYITVILILFVNYTFSKYAQQTNSTSTIEVAKFNIKVNDKKIEEKKFNLLLSSVNNTSNNKLLPDSEGYFEIAINPEGTHVSLEYEITFDLSKINSEIINEDNEKRNIVLTGYSLDNGITVLDMPENNQIIGEINLEENSTGFSAEDTVDLRIYWEWKQDITNPTFENTAVQVTSIVKQKIENGSEL